MRLSKVLLGALAATAVVAAVPASAAVLTLGGGWSGFFNVNPNYPDPDGGPLYDIDTGDTSYTFTLTGDSVLKITDLYYNLDQFDITINGVDQGPTSYPQQDYVEPQADPDLAFADPHFSHGEYALGPGFYEVTGVSIFSPYGYNVGAIELDVPEPAAWAMMLAGFGLVGGLVRRRGARAALAA
jgi:hypothetical protein